MSCSWAFGFELRTRERSYILNAPTRREREHWVRIFMLLKAQNARQLVASEFNPLIYEKLFHKVGEFSWRVKPYQSASMKVDEHSAWSTGYSEQMITKVRLQFLFGLNVLVILYINSNHFVELNLTDLRRIELC